LIFRTPEKELREISNETVVIILDENTEKSRLSEWLAALNQVIIRKNKIVCVNVRAGAENDFAENIFAYLIANRVYNLYVLESAELLSDEYLNMIQAREADVTEVENYLRENFTDYNGAYIALELLRDAAASGDMDALKSCLDENEPHIRKAVNILAGLKASNDILAAKAAGGQMGAEEISELKSALDEKDAKIASLINDVNSSGVQSYVYKPVAAGAVKAQLRHIIYFKELSYVKYMNSFVAMLQDMLKAKGKYEVKLLIFDRKTDFMTPYHSLPLVGMPEFERNREQVLAAEKAVIIDPNRNILTAFLTSARDVLIIYDRLKDGEDLVTGTNISTFYVMNSKKELRVLRGKREVPLNRCFLTYSSTDEQLRGTNGIYAIQGYEQATPASRGSKYFSMVNKHSTVKDEPLMKHFCKMCNIKIDGV
jgi:hypothetical protein